MPGGRLTGLCLWKGCRWRPSGDYRNYYGKDGQRFSHTIDPRTGRPVQHRLASVSVVHGRCVAADGWATALMVLGETDGYQLAVEQGLTGLFLVRDGEGGFSEKATPAFSSLFGPGAPETSKPSRPGRDRTR